MELKEAYAGFSKNWFEINIGNQIVSWGRADGFNPTNNITPNNYFLLTYEPDDQKMSNFLIQTKFNLSPSFNFEIIAIPFYLPSIYKYELFNIQEGVNYLPIETPEVNLENGSLAGKFNVEHPFIGFSASYFTGFDPYYGFGIKDFTLSPLQINYYPKPYHKQTFGFDFTLPVKSWILRCELAYNKTEDYKENMHIPNPDLYYVAGLEKSVFETTVILQYIGKYTFHFEELSKPTLGGFTPEDFYQYGMEMIPYESTIYNRKIFNQQEETNHAAMLSLNRSFFYETLSSELSGYYNFTSEEYLVRGQIKWNIADNITANLGAHFMFGPDNSIYNMSGKVINGVFTGLEVNF